eukprot:TRINITY_DN57020_c0_g1_i1.p1 TRINITY_DN57020_c0_g1~~TRINITY_DN57020_c0_g1_i1.p1  ORF type:complete len:359 (-),score=68.16 TRINITY_DN57020_c0_g1_i1:167-1243(-)
MATSLQAKLASLKQQLKADNSAAAVESEGPAAKRTKTDMAGANGEASGSGARLGARPKALSASSPIREQDAEGDTAGHTPPVPKTSQTSKAPSISMSIATPAPKRGLARTPSIGTKAPPTAPPTAKAPPREPGLSLNMPLDKLRELARYHCVRVAPSADEADIIAALRKDGVDNKEIDSVLEIDGPAPERKEGGSTVAKRAKDDGSRKGAKAACRRWKPAFAVTPFEWEKKEAEIKAKAKQLALPGPAPKMSATATSTASAKPVGYKAPSLSLMDKALGSSIGAKPASLAGPPPTPDSSTTPGAGAVGLGARPKASTPPPGWKSETPPPKAPGGKPDLCWEFVAGNCSKGLRCKWPHS